MAPSPIGQRLLKMLGFVNHKNTPSGSKNVPINLYTNFYFHVEHKTGSDQDGEEEEDQSPDFQPIDFSRHRLTVENLKKVKVLRKSRSVEAWLSSLDSEAAASDSLHYACVDVTGLEQPPPTSPGSRPQNRMFARSRDIFQSYSSLSTFNINLGTKS